ncbi:MAG: SDR family oxidoreductase [Trueperaceae bacterium]|nr:SDR family oxidoreductase [Trueperaceae bacterium]
MDPQGRTALVTGGSKGIGLGIAEAMVDAGMDVVITARTKDDVERAEAELTARGGGRALGIPCDVRDLGQQRAAVAEAMQAFGRLDVLIANAGVGHFASIVDLEPDAWHRVLDTNLTGVFYSIKAALEPLEAAEGLVVTIGSLAGTNFFEGGAAYNASKFGLAGFSQAVMLDLRRKGVRVSTIMPGSVATHFGGHEPGDADAWKIQPEDVGSLVMELVRMPARTLPSKIEVRPSRPPSAR